MVEAVRVGTIIASDRKAFRRWSTRRNASTPSPALSDAQLEQALMSLAGQFPGHIEFGTLPA